MGNDPIIEEAVCKPSASKAICPTMDMHDVSVCANGHVVFCIAHHSCTSRLALTRGGCVPEPNGPNYGVVPYFIRGAEPTQDRRGRDANNCG